MIVILFFFPLSCFRILKNINKAISLLLRVICHLAAFFKETPMTVATMQNTLQTFLRIWLIWKFERLDLRIYTYIIVVFKDTGRGTATCFDRRRRHVVCERHISTAAEATLHCSLSVRLQNISQPNPSDWIWCCFFSQRGQKKPAI